MKQYDSLVIGHICKDKNTDCNGNTVYAEGGAALFSSAAAFALGHRVGVVTKVAAGDQALAERFTVPQEDVYCVYGGRTTLMENTYFTPDKERRRSVCAAQGEPITVNDIPQNVSAGVYQLAGLVVGDFAPGLIETLAGRGAVALDAQGYLRNVDPAKGGEMYYADWKEKARYLPCLSFLKADAAEAEILTGESDPVDAAKALSALGAREAVITYNGGVLAYFNGKLYTAPFHARSLAGRTGRGDTTFAVYLCERLTKSPAEALLTAAAAVSLKMETPGPLRCTRADVENYIQRFYTV